MGYSSVELAALIGSRICHDLISPIGAINNGLELLEMSGGAKGPELDLINDSVGNAGARIRFFRISFGAAGEQMLGRAEITSVLDDLSRGGRLRFRWEPVDPLPRAEVRLAFLALQCFETAMPYGGTVHVQAENGTWTLTSDSDKLSVDEALWAGLSDADRLPGITPALVQFALIPAVATDMGRRVSTQHENGQVTLRF